VSDAGALVRSCREEISAAEKIIAGLVDEKPRGNNEVAIRSAPPATSISADPDVSTFHNVPHVARRRNKDGTFRYYFRRRGFPSRPLPDPTAPEFDAAYAAASAPPGEPIAVIAPTFVLSGDDPIAAPLVMLWCALKSGDRDRAESIAVRLSASINESTTVDRRAVDEALSVAMAMVRARTEST
jgi:hypothetical protein